MLRKKEKVKRVIVSLLGMLLLFNLFLLSPAGADSPVTSTPFSDAYLDVEMVEKARLTGGVINEELCQFLASPEHSLEIKAAAINSLYNHSNVWGVKNNAQVYTGQIYQAAPGELDLSALSAEELLVIGYLLLLDDYIQPGNALPCLEQAKKLAPENYTIAMMHALARVQRHDSWGSVWLLTKEVAANPALKEDRLREEAVSTILDYTCLYRNPQDDIAVFINDKFHITETDPIILARRTLVPWRELFDALGAQAAWDEENEALTATRGETTVMLSLDQPHATVNGKAEIVDQPATMCGGELMVPLRFVSEAFGAGVHWDGKTRSIKVSLSD